MQKQEIRFSKQRWNAASHSWKSKRYKNNYWSSFLLGVISTPNVSLNSARSTFLSTDVKHFYHPSLQRAQQKQTPTNCNRFVCDNSTGFQRCQRLFSSPQLRLIGGRWWQVFRGLLIVLRSRRITAAVKVWKLLPTALMICLFCFRLASRWMLNQMLMQRESSKLERGENLLIQAWKFVKKDDARQILV